MRPVIVSVLSALAICFVLATSAQAAPTGMQIFVNVGGTTGNTTNIDTATTFTFGLLATTADNTGVFASMPSQTFSSVSIDLTNPTSLTFSSVVFGTFTSTSITVKSDVPGGVVLLVEGEWTAGTVSSVSGTFPALFTISLSQTPAGTGLISMSASFSTPIPSLVPEPSSVVLVFLGLALGVAVWGFHRGRGYLALRQAPTV